MAAAATDGSVVPSMTFKARIRDEKIGGDNPFTWKDVTSDELFKGKRAVVFALPGAFTPTCSSTHLPGYEAAYGTSSVYSMSFLGLAHDNSTTIYEIQKRTHAFFETV
jgi:peroxiredoxin